MAPTRISCSVQVACNSTLRRIAFSALRSANPGLARTPLDIDNRMPRLTMLSTCLRTVSFGMPVTLAMARRDIGTMCSGGSGALPRRTSGSTSGG
jgi:hypothetical protein